MVTNDDDDIDYDDDDDEDDDDDDNDDDDDDDAMEYDLTGMAVFGSEAKEDFLGRGHQRWPLSYNPRR